MSAHALALSFLPGILSMLCPLAILPVSSCFQSHQYHAQEAGGLPGGSEKPLST